MGRHGFFRVPPADEERRPVDRATVRRVVRTFRPYKRKVGLVGLAIVVTSGLGVVNPLLIKWIFDNGLFGDPPGSCGASDCPQLDTVYTGVALMIAIPRVRLTPLRARLRSDGGRDRRGR